MKTLQPPDTTTPAPDVQAQELCKHEVELCKVQAQIDAPPAGYADRAFTDAEWAIQYAKKCRERDAALVARDEHAPFCEKHRADEQWRGLTDCLACATEELEARVVELDSQIDAAVATAKEQLEAREKSSRNLAYYALHDEGFDAPMSGNDLATRDQLRDLRQVMEFAFTERAKAQRAVVYLAREAGGSPVSGEVELDRHGQEIRAAIAKLHEHSERIARLTGFVSMRLGVECAGLDSVDTAIAFMEHALVEIEPPDAMCRCTPDGTAPGCWFHDRPSVVDAETERYARIGKLYVELWEAGAPWPVRHWTCDKHKVKGCLRCK